ncbi:MAG TPA: type II toxin-antitoxin system RelB/DinJ family antitoxin [Candidatus Paceibacterota bacterium]|nr:type II toxin-antitoxin system RelB/DinJ family antitoxin [Candidatus Paceibacterota bacterium]
MAKTAYISARVDKKIKAEAQKVLRDVGVNTSDAVDMFLRQVVMHQGIPFEVRRPNKETRKALREVRAGKVKRYTGTTKEIIDQMLRDTD